MGNPLLLGLLPALVLAQSQPTFYAAWEDGQEAERRGQFETALADYQRATELRPRSSAHVIIYGNNVLAGYYPYTRIAKCCLELSKWESAEKALAQAEGEGEPPAERKLLTQRWRESVPAKPLPPTAPVPIPNISTQPMLSAPAPASPPTPAITEPPVPAALPTHVASPGSPALASVPIAPQRHPSPPLPPAPPSLSAQQAQAKSSTSRTGSALLWTLASLSAAGTAAWLWKGRKRPAFDRISGLPERVGPYRIERLLGQGGFASTYLARRDGDKTPVALKILHAFRQDDLEFLERFRQEARLGALLEHPHIVRLLDQGPQEGTPWLAMEYVQGLRMDTFLKGQESLPLPIPQAVGLAFQVAQAMAYAHAQGVIHRDLKPGNVMIVGDQAKVMDFGIARTLDSETLTTTYAFLGTPLYAAPELQLKTRVGPAADRYSFGIMLYELLAGHPPFRGETPFEILDQHRHAALPDLKTARPDTPVPLLDLINRLTRKDPAERPTDEETLEILQHLQLGEVSPIEK